jgi:hypothetical protein
LLYTRREMIGAGLLAISSVRKGASAVRREPAKNPISTVFRSVNGTPQENMNKVIEMLGGIHEIIGSEDVVVIKPNVQWWNQGAPNLSALNRFVELIFEMPGGFAGEVVVAENCHRGSFPWLSEDSGWAHRFERNSDSPNIGNYVDLTGSLKKKFGDRFTTRHWIDVANGAKRVYGPKNGDGYIYCDGTGGAPLLTCENGMKGEDCRTTIMTYPIFTTDKGTLVDLRNGVWAKGAYTSRPLRFINFAAVNHHSIPCGATSAIKNYLGIVDL